MYLWTVTVCVLICYAESTQVISMDNDFSKVKADDQLAREMAAITGKLAAFKVRVHPRIKLFYRMLQSCARAHARHRADTLYIPDMYNVLPRYGKLREGGGRDGMAGGLGDDRGVILSDDRGVNVNEDRGVRLSDDRVVGVMGNRGVRLNNDRDMRLDNSRGVGVNDYKVTGLTSNGGVKLNDNSDIRLSDNRGLRFDDKGVFINGGVGLKENSISGVISNYYRGAISTDRSIRDVNTIGHAEVNVNVERVPSVQVIGVRGNNTGQVVYDGLANK